MNGPDGVRAATSERIDAATPSLTRGVTRLLRALDYRVLTEFPLANGRRADVLGLHRQGTFALVEVKVSVADFRADGKWPDYLDYCDVFYFGVTPRFPLALLPADRGIIVADAYDAAIVREAPAAKLGGARRKALTLRFARTAAARLHHLTDPLAAARRGP